MTSTLTLKQAELFDKILIQCIEESSNSDHRDHSYDSQAIEDDFQIPSDIAVLFLKTIVEKEYQNLKIVKSEMPYNGSIEDSWFSINDNTIDFINAGGFRQIYNNQFHEWEKKNEKESLEDKKLKNDLENHKFYKYGFWITLISAIISILINIYQAFKHS